MAKVLSTVDKIICGYAGQVQPSSSAKLQVMGQTVLVASSVKGATVGSCTGSASQQPNCNAVESLSAGESQKLQAGGEAVLLDSLAGKTTPAHEPNTLALLTPVVQTKLEAS